MIVNAKEMLKIQKQMEQKEKNRPIHSDYCLECGCPKEICCEKRGRVEELKKDLEYFKEKERSARDGFYSESYGDKKVIFQVLSNYSSEVRRIEKRLLELK